MTTRRICIKCGKETQEIPCPYCGGGTFQNAIIPKKRLEEDELMRMMGLKPKGSKK